MKRLDKIFLILIALLPVVDQLITKVVENYFVGLIIRLSTHFGIPLLWYYMRKEDLKLYTEAFIIKNKKDKLQTIKYSILGSLGAIILISGLFFLLKSQFDFSLIKDQVGKLYNLTIPIYIVISLSISFLNPLIEEFFWRGFIFKEYNKKGKGKYFGIWIGLFFALHHAVMLYSWFSLILLLVVLTGLAIVGVLFNWMQKKTGSIYSGLITHAAADITIIIIGFFILF